MILPLLLSQLTQGPSTPQGQGVPVLDTRIVPHSWTTDDGLPQNSVTGLALDGEGFLWVATFGGLARFDGEGFEVFDVGDRDDLPSSRFRTAYAARDGSIWFGTMDLGLVRFHEGRFEQFDLPTPVTYILEDGQGAIWVTSPRGVYRLVDGEFERLADWGLGACALHDGSIWYSDEQGLVHATGGERVRLREDAGLPASACTAVLEDDRGQLWVALRGGALYRSRSALEPSFEVEPWPEENVRRITQTTDGCLWFSSLSGLYRLDPRTGERSFVRADGESPMQPDAHGNLWAGGRGDGLTCYTPSPLFSTDEALGLPRTDAWVVGLDRGGRPMVGTSAGLYVHDGDAYVQQAFGNHISCLLELPGERWIGAVDRVVRVRGTQRTEFPLDVDRQGQARCLLQDSSGLLWLGTDRTLLTFDGRGFAPVEPARGAVHCLLEGSHGEVWAGGTEGLQCVAGGPARAYDSSSGLGPGIVRALLLDADGRLWVGSYGGGLSLVTEDGVFRFSRTHGLPDDHVSYLAQDDQGRLWVNSNKGPFALHLEQLLRVAAGAESHLDAITFSAAEGAVEANGGHQPSGCITADGRIWLATVRGITVVDPSRLPRDEPPPHPVIEPLVLGEGRSLTARFHVPGSASPSRLRVEVRLGDDSAWTRSDRERSVSFPRIGPGEHRFEVRARNGHGPWSAVATSSVRVPARFTETLWFPVALVVLTAGLATGLGRVQLRRVRDREQHLLALVRQLEAAERSLEASRHTLRRLSAELMHAQESERTRLAAELHDDITQRLAALSIQVEVCLARVGGDLGPARPQLEEAVTLAQTLATDVQRLSRRLHPVGLRTLGLEEAVRSECGAFARRTGLTLRTDLALGERELPERVSISAFRVLQEALHNVEKHAATESLDVGLSASDDQLVLYVQDHGRGFEIDGATPVGLGLVTMQERAHSMGGELEIRSTPGVGTTIELHVRIAEARP